VIQARRGREPPGPPDNGSIEEGTVGWGDDGPHYELDTTTGVTLVKVTLFRGRDPDADGEKPDKRARGHKILARIGAPLFYIPADGAQVIVVLPAGHGHVPGGPVILTAVVPAPPVQFGTNDGKDVVLDFGEDRRVIIKAGRGVILSDYENRYVGVGPDIGFKIGDPDASGAHLKAGKWQLYACAPDGDIKAMVQLMEGDTKINHKDGGGVTALTMSDGDVYAIGANCYLFSAGVYLGAGAVAINKVAYIAGGAPVASATVNIQV
jgi:hypothetical protein